MADLERVRSARIGETPPGRCKDRFLREVWEVKSYVFRVVLEPDEDVWRVYVPGLEEQGAATWGHTKEEALKNIQEVVQMVIEEEPIRR